MTRAMRAGWLGVGLGVLAGVGLVRGEEDCRCQWQRYAHDVHRFRVGDIRPVIDAVNAALPAEAKSGPELAEVRALLALEPQPVRATNLLGPVRLRSLQVSRDLGVFVYPWFAGEVKREGKGCPVFRKTTGSQRRTGRLFDPGDDRLVFLGGVHVNDDPPRTYSGLQEPRTGPEASDTAGVLTCIGPDRWLMILDASESGYELYEIRRAGRPGKPRPSPKTPHGG